MGFFDFFSSKPTAENIRKQVIKAKEAYAQPDYRQMAMDKLLKWDTDESLKGLLERFCSVVQSPHYDEKEKRWLVEEFVKKGDRVLNILREFILNKNEINYALIAAKKILNNDENYIELLISSLKHRPPQDHRSTQAKQELIKSLREIKDSELEDLLLPYLEDHSDDVQCESLEALAKSDQPAVKNALIKLIQSDLHSPRVLRKAAQIVADRKILLDNNITLQPPVEEDYFLKNGLLVRR